MATETNCKGEVTACSTAGNDRENVAKTKQQTAPRDKQVTGGQDK